MTFPLRCLRAWRGPPPARGTARIEANPAPWCQIARGWGGLWPVAAACGPGSAWLPDVCSPLPSGVRSWTDSFRPARETAMSSFAPFLRRPQRRGSSASQTVPEALRSPGEPLTPDTRAAMETMLSRDFSRVRVHTEPTASSSAAALGAEAYAVGHHIVLGPNAPALATMQGRALLGHELTHVVQQENASPRGHDDLAISSASEPAESEAAGCRGNGQQPVQAAGGTAHPASPRHGTRQPAKPALRGGNRGRSNCPPPPSGRRSRICPR